MRGTSHEADGYRGDWRIWSPRAETKPTGIRLPDGSLILTASSAPDAFGGWVKSVRGIREGIRFRFEAEYQVQGLSRPAKQVLVRLEWRDRKWERVGNPVEARRLEKKGAWTRVWEEAQAPAGAAGAELQLLLFEAGQGTAVFRKAMIEVAASGK